MNKLLILFIFLTSATIQAHAQQSKQIRVSVNVSADTVIKSQFSSKINSALRRLGDVTVVETDPLYEIHIVALTNTTGRAQLAGYTVSIVVIEHGISKDTIHGLIDSMTGNVKEVLKGICVKGSFVHHSVLTGPDDLEEIAQRTVADIDVGPLENQRKFLQQVEDMKKRPIPKP